jgi:putative CocE/NonD family hydrolase
MTKKMEIISICMLVFFAVLSNGNAAVQSEKRVSKPGLYSGYSPLTYTEVVRSSRYIPIRGNNLAIDIYRPAVNGVPVNKPYPVILENMRYQRRRDIAIEGPTINDWVKRGYVVAIVDPRGAGASFGSRNGDWSIDEALDGKEIIEWLAAQPYSDGKVGMWGLSYMGGIQFMIASTRPPHLKAIMPQVATIDQFFRNPNGVVWTPPAPPKSVMFPLAGMKANPSQTVDADPTGTMLQAAVAEHAANVYSDQEWMPSKTFRNQYKPEIRSMNFISQSAITYKDDIKASGVAVYNIGGWYDAGPAQALAAWKLWGGKVIIGPWAHTSAREAEIVKVEHLRWYDYTLKGIKNGVDKEPPIYYYTFNAPVGKEWQFASQWPLPEQKLTRFYFGPGRTGTSASSNDGMLISQAPSATDAKDSRPVDYSTKVFEEGGADRFRENNRSWSGDMEKSTDSKGLTYTSSPLAADMQITGIPVIRLWASSTSTDAYFFAFIEEIDKTNRSKYVTNGMIRASNRAVSKQSPWTDLGMVYHRSYDIDAQPLTPGEPVELAFDVYPTSYVFKAGNRIRVTITGAFQSTYAVPKEEPAPVMGIYRDSAHPSHMELPVIPRH